jgi:riboflavin kinase/FMN adenylyltransferase
MSSSRIRQLIGEGLLDDAARFLGRYPSVRGRVVKGDQRGRTLGFPTANLAIAERRLIPADGIYAVRVKIGDQWHGGAANIGIRPTFDSGHRLVEVYVLDFDDDLYDQVIEVQFIKRLREEIKFGSVDALIEQMKKDVDETRIVLAKA